MPPRPSPPSRTAPEGEAEFLAVTGPTASGKTALSLEIARLLDGEIVSMDSRQVYRGMDVGTAKVSLQDRARAPHHGLDLLDPDQAFSAVEFARFARGRVRAIRSRGRVPILVGGTGFFLRALTDPIFREPVQDAGLRARLRDVLAGMDRSEQERWVRRLDPERADAAVAGGAQRMIRTLEVALLSGRPLSWWHRFGAPEARPVRGVVVTLQLPREELDRRIDGRVAIMVKEGLVEEVCSLLAAGYGPDAPGMSAVGYRQMVEHARGDASLEEALERVRQATRQYARRQLTWFRNQLPEGSRILNGLLPLSALAEEAVRVWLEGGR